MFKFHLQVLEAFQVDKSIGKLTGEEVIRKIKCFELLESPKLRGDWSRYIVILQESARKLL
jgi:hypothetical protein